MIELMKYRGPKNRNLKNHFIFIMSVTISSLSSVLQFDKRILANNSM